MTRLAQYYGVPAVSLRDALFHELKAADPRFPVKQVFHDRHHPGAWGHLLMAQMVEGSGICLRLRLFRIVATGHPPMP